MNPADDLIRYVSRPDGAFHWERRGGERSAQASLITLHLTSQVWQGVRWEHRLQIVVPDNLTHPETALLYATGDGTSSEIMMGLALAQATGTLCALLYNVPNQPLFDGLAEDALIAHTFVQFLDTGDADWPMLYPMVKSVVRAMDALQAWSAEETGQIRRFIVGGASKRGWTSWLTAAAEDRVAAIIPMVYDNLNLFAQMPHQVEVWGDYSEQISDYTEYDLPNKMNSERGHYLTLAVDPYTFRDRLTLPKLLVNGANDRYWATDALNLYWNDLPGPKWALYVPNSGHHLEDYTRVFNTMSAFLRAMAAGQALPSADWQFASSGRTVGLTLTADTAALEARLWVARSATRDFRNAPWNAVFLRPEADGTRFTGEVEKPASGHIAVFGEIAFEGPGQPFTLSTQPHISHP
jgi:PhoPQ-activated pathogenicity-related protein